MSTITRELAKLFRKITNSEIDAEGNAHVVLSPADSLLINNARIALASLETEASGRNPVLAYADSYRDMANQGVESIPVWSVITDLERNIAPLFTAPPAPVSVPDEVCWEDVPDEITEDDMEVALAWAHGFNQCRAAMLQGAEQQQNQQQNIPENIPGTLFKPVADLYGLTSPTGGETSFTFDAVEARDFIDGGWSCQEYVELGRFQEAITNHTEDKLAMVDHSGDSNNMVEPVTTAYKSPDSWMACRDQNPEGGRYLALFGKRTKENCDPYVDEGYLGSDGEFYFFDWEGGPRINDCDPYDKAEVTHWMYRDLPAAPQQEVK